MDKENETMTEHKNIIHMEHHEHIVHESRLRSLLKGFTAKAVEVTVDTIIINVILHMPVESFGIAIGLEVFCYLCGYANERIWNKAQWGRKVIDKICQE
jgi:hypothetical protein